ncbi:MAG: ribosome silencing factor [Alkalibacterium sp.]|uniref:Ribosomal silencing factor RsfS n=1 Tax=Alkalibacterium gilvum TaxID=1130080 RepID=A0A1H6TVB5_9LACT|nr:MULTISPECIES: ribosome silencing factor [Alkalibacterium]MDN6194664.1 ribosome silencing factor [Alkalibacterium sp.]MDN6293136.1 ribosome silencing factor [Alkalibacterium sp.]MDN6295051.1 ribosome silencing factor [Alkalibacterium sp.]MDN6327308.1 ribosome silencing factor [Alkalibacterium sp.]MDN6397587.1 ribosome silencing factor [Alkalibacterium sp.]
MQKSLDLLEQVVKAADSKQANDIVALDMKEVSLLADYFVILHANNERQLNAIARNILDEADEHGNEIKRIEGKDEGKWILIDLGDVIIHLFNEEEREFYKLERLWSDAGHVDISNWLD